MRLFRLLAVASALLATTAAPPAVSQSNRTSAAAPVSSLISRVDIPYETFTLANGLRVVVHEDRKAPVVAVSIWYNVGSKDEPKGKTGFAHLFEHLMFNGSENSPGDFFEPLRQIGATDLNGTTSYDRTNYFQTVPTGALEMALFLESDRMGHLLGAVTQDKLTNQIGVVQNEKRESDNQPYGLVEYVQLENLFPEGHPYHHSVIGSMADLSSASLEDVKGWFRENYGPNNAVLVLAGDIDSAQARPLVQKYFGDIARGPVNEPAQAAVVTLDQPKSVELKDRVAQTRIYRNWTTPGLLDPESVPLQVGLSVLGGLSSSRLDNALVRQEKSAVRAAAWLQPYHRVGMAEVQVDVKPGEDADKVAQRLDAIIADLVRNGPTEDEVRRVVASSVAARLRGLEQVGGFGGKAVALAEGTLYAEDPDFYKKRLAQLAAVTPAQVRAALQKWVGRPGLAIKVVPGERDAYEEAPAAAAAAPPPAPALAPAGNRTAPPVGTLAELEFPDVERRRLSNGIEIVYARRQAVPVTRVAVEFDAGWAADPKDKLGTHTLMLNLLTEGTTSRNSIAIAEEQERLGAVISGSGSPDRTALFLTALTPNLSPSLDLLADIVKNPAFAPDEVARLRDQQLASIAQELTQPQSIAFRVLPPLLYSEQHPYGVPLTGSGDPRELATVTRADLVAFHNAWVRPDNAKIFVVSDRPLAELVPQLEQHFGRWAAPAGRKGTKAAPARPQVQQERIVLVDRPQSPQSLILAGTVMPIKGTDDTLPLNAANDALGGDFLSRINMDLRETKGWAYGAYGFPYLLEGPSPYVVFAPVQSNRTGESIAALRQQISDFVTSKGVMQEELTRTVNGNTRELPGSYETSAAVLAALRSNDLFDRPDNYQESLPGRYRALTTAELDRAARGAIKPNEIVWVVVGDASVVREQLDKLGLPIEVMKLQ